MTPNVKPPPRLRPRSLPSRPHDNSRPQPGPHELNPRTPGPDRCHRRMPVGSNRAQVTRTDRARFRDGDPEAVRTVFRAYGRLAYTVAFRVLGNRALAEEATQQ